jgi:uncharacterized protein (DUF1499 family)
MIVSAVACVLLLVVIGLGSFFGAAWWSAQNTPELGLVDGRLRPCPALPNCVSSQADVADGTFHVEPLPAGEGLPEQQQARVIAAIEAAFGERAAFVGPAGFDQEGYARWAVRTPVAGFVDDLELLHDVGAGVFHVRSASRIGGGDGGVNRARVESLAAELARQ